MKNKRKRAACLLLAVLCVVQLLTIFCVTAFAAGETAYTDVLEDLKRDGDFDKTSYPDDPNNFGFQVITVAESVDRELFVYVYQPAAATTPLTATSINISKTHKAFEFVNYSLVLLDQEGVFQKYKVENFVVDNVSMRYYEITNILRLPRFEGETSTGVDDGNIINELPFGVGKSFQFTGYPDGNQVLYVDDIEFITVTSKYVGFVRYPASTFLWWTTSSLDVHFVAFSTDKQIDELLEADVYYKKQHVGGYYLPGDVVLEGQEFHPYVKFGSKEPQNATLKFNASMKYENDSWFSVDHEWNTIETPEAFLSSTEGTTKIYEAGIFESTYSTVMTEESKQFISSQDWVLRFAYTPYNTTVSAMPVARYDYDHYIVSDVMILRLAFKTKGVYYNLGVVDNKQTGKGSPDGTSKTEFGFAEWFEKLMALILFVIFLVIFWPLVLPILGFLVKIVFSGLWLLLKILLKILFLPIRLIWRILFLKKE